MNAYGYSAQQLLSGSNEIDRMRKEIKQLVSMVEGLIPRSQLKSHQNTNERFKQNPNVVYGVVKREAPEEVVWQINWSVCLQGDLDFPRTGLAIQIGFGNPRGYQQEMSKIPAKFVAAVHTSMDTLVDLVLENWPSVQEGTRPFVEASATKSTD